jgi:PDZ domain-containing secreted protein/Zn-dependent protease/CBS domain-containing protein
MLESSFTFLTVRGIPIGAHWSWLFVFALVLWLLGSQLFPRTYPGMSPGGYWAMAAFAAVLFFGSVLLHELGHALTALREGMRIEGITLWLFGGVARFSSMFRSPGGEFAIAILGPVISLALALLFAALTWLGNALDLPVAVVGVTDYLARINLIVLLFNLVPALPLDGGRVLRAWLWRRQGNFEAATATAARAGQLFGVTLIAIGILGFFTGAGAGGLWFAFIGWFLLQAAQGEAVHAQLRGAFRGLRVRDVMTPDPQVVRPDDSVQEVVERARLPRNPSSYPVIDGGRLVGLVSLRQVAHVPVEERGLTRVSEVMSPRDEVSTLDPEAELDTAMESFRQGVRRSVVLDDDRPVGIVSMSDLSRTAERRRLEGEAEPRRVRRAGALPWLVVVVAVALAAGFLYRPPVVVLAPGSAIDITADITISGVSTDPVNGRYLLTSVEVSQPTGIGALIALFRPERDMVPLSSVVPRGVDPERFSEEQRELFRQSRLIAVGAAAQAVGMHVAVTGTGAEVVNVVPGTPAADALQSGDVILQVDETEVRLADDLGTELRAHPAGTRFDLTIERGGGTRTVAVRTTRIQGETGPIVGIGVLVHTRDFSVNLPFDVQFRDRPGIGGPSAGLAYALAVADMLEPEDLAQGRTIAATGTIDIDGSVGEVGGVALKADAVEAAGGELFLVPPGDVREARDGPVPVRAVQDLSNALEVLRSAA